MSVPTDQSASLLEKGNVPPLPKKDVSPLRQRDENKRSAARTEASVPNRTKQLENIDVRFRDRQTEIQRQKQINGQKLVVKKRDLSEINERYQKKKEDLKQKQEEIEALNRLLQSFEADKRETEARIKAEAEQERRLFEQRLQEAQAAALAESNARIEAARAAAEAYAREQIAAAERKRQEERQIAAQAASQAENNDPVMISFAMNGYG